MAAHKEDIRNQLFNLYSGFIDNEADMYRMANDELIHLYGLNCKYLPRTTNNLDRIFGESQNNTFDDSYSLVLMPMNMLGWEAETYLYSKFGFTNDTTQGFLVEVNRFREVLKDASITSPREGDLIYVERFGKFFEISFFDDDDEIFYHHGQLYIFSIYTKHFRYSHEIINTGDSTVDSAAPQPGASNMKTTDNNAVSEYDLKKQISEEMDEIEDIDET